MDNHLVQLRPRAERDTKFLRRINPWILRKDTSESSQYFFFFPYDTLDIIKSNFSQNLSLL